MDSSSCAVRSTHHFSAVWAWLASASQITDRTHSGYMSYNVTARKFDMYYIIVLRTIYDVSRICVTEQKDIGEN